MSVTKKIVLHFGLPKTGTTSIQNVFYAHRDLLLERTRLLYPSVQANLTTPLCTIFQHDPRRHIANKMAGISTDDEISLLRNKYQSALDTEISSKSWDTLLLSAEGVSNLSREELGGIKKWGENYASEWTVLICVRHPIAYVRSVTQQLMKGGETLSQLAQNLPLPNFTGKISNAISVFGLNNIRVFDFDDASGEDGGIVGSFARLVGLSGEISNMLSRNAVRDNESLSFEAVSILDSLNRLRPLFHEGKRAPGRSGGEDLAYIGRIRGSRFDLPDAVKKKIRMQCRDDVSWLNNTFGIRIYSDIYEDLSRMEEALPIFSKETSDSIAEIIGELVASRAFRRNLDWGKVALSRGDLEEAKRKLLEAARLDPAAPQPSQLLNEIANRKP